MTPETNQYLVDFQQAIDKAKLQDFTVVSGSSRVLLLDLDSPDDVRIFSEREGLLKCFLPVLSIERWPSKSGIGEHVQITTDKDMTATERILIQCAMGSDGIHEFLSLATGIWQGNEEPTVLFRPPPKAVCTASQETK